MSDSDEFDAQPTPPPVLKADRGRDRADRDEWDIEDSKVTDPLDWLARDLDDSERELLDRSGYRDSGSAVSAGRFVQLVAVTDQREKKARRRHRKIVEVLREIRRTVSPETVDAIRTASATAKTIRRVAIAVAVAAAGSLAGGWATYSAHERQAGADEERLHRAEQDAKDNGVRIDDVGKECRRSIEQLRLELGRHSSINVSQPASTLATKGPTS